MQISEQRNRNRLSTLGLRLAAAIAVVALASAGCDAEAPRQATTPAQAETPVDEVRATLARVLEDDDPFSRARTLAAFLPDLGPSGVPAVREILEQQWRLLAPSDTALLLGYWATHEGAEASGWAREDTLMMYRRAAVLATFSTWATLDPQAAGAVAESWSDSTETEQVIPAALVGGWLSSSEPDGLQDYMQNLPPSIFRQRVISSHVNLLLVSAGTEGVLAWMNAIPDDDAGGTFKLDAHRRVVIMLTGADREAGLALCEIHCEGPYGKNLRTIVARSWARNDAPAAMAWLSTAPEGFERDVAVKQVFVEWMVRDREATFDWMKAQPVEATKPWLKAAYPVYSVNLVHDSPPEAIEWAEQIEGEWEREAALIAIAQVWRGRDENAAEAWVADSPLSEMARRKARIAVRGKAAGR